MNASAEGFWTLGAGSGTASIRADNDSGSIRVEGDGHTAYLGYGWGLSERIDGLLTANFARLQDVDEVNDSVVGAELGVRLKLPADGLPKPAYVITTAGWHYGDAVARHGASLMIGAGIPVLVWRRASVDLQYQYRYINWRDRDGYNELRSQLSQGMISAEWRF
ncbi:hypothetical protein CHH28_02020 [Bacterioplanes sanyensis]|uniref:Outer membrane protein beta-barrel domain-containing protein n=2 Tax=Bacterioplanes sanyensis TaxID=1249553 RepID=A0A222FH00_9GAMM|nr:hypothetical protein CHH28_02020 [Bacterioplanes sanyensis]